MKHVFWIALVFLCACSSVSTETVEFRQINSPKENFRELRKIGVVKVKNFPPYGNTYFQKRMKRCNGFTKATPVQRHFTIDYTNPQTISSSYEKSVKNYPKSRSVHGFISLDVVKKEIKKEKTPFNIETYSDISAHELYSDAGVFSDHNLGLAAPLIYAPKVKARSKRLKGSTMSYELELNYSVYNTVLKKLVIQGSVRGKATLVNYSSGAKIGSAWVYHRLTKGLIDKVAKKVCFLGPMIERTIYSPNDDSSVSKKIELGVEQAEQGRWEVASKTWGVAVKKQKKNALAHHNLGVAYEQQGELEKAFEHYYLARKGKLAKEIEIDRYELMLSSQSNSIGKPTRPIIYAVDSGNWVRMERSHKLPLKAGKVYSVYRQHIVGGSSDLVKGIKIMETGSVSIEKVYPTYILARIKSQTVENEGVSVGDMVIP